MNDKILERLQKFIEKERWVYKFPLTRETKLYEDLGIYGDDSVNFLLSYAKEFKVDVSNFMAADYFKGEGIDFLGPIIKFITGKSRLKSSKRKTLTLGHLEKGIIAGILDEDVINSLDNEP